MDIYDGTFNLVNSFTEPSAPAGFAPFGAQDINNMVYVTYARTSGGTGGFVSVFKEDGTFVKELVHRSVLNQPWGLALAPSALDRSRARNCVDGAAPAFASLVRDGSGNLYGVAQRGAYQSGIVFKLTP